MTKCRSRPYAFPSNQQHCCVKAFHKPKTSKLTNRLLRFHSSPSQLPLTPASLSLHTHIHTHIHTKPATHPIPLTTIPYHTHPSTLSFHPALRQKNEQPCQNESYRNLFTFTFTFDATYLPTYLPSYTHSLPYLDTQRALSAY